MAYTPIDCSLHDRLEAIATLRRTVAIVVQDADGTRREIADRLVDVFARSGEEFVRTAGGEEIRLDRLESVDGVPFRKPARGG